MEVHSEEYSKRSEDRFVIPVVCGMVLPNKMCLTSLPGHFSHLALFSLPERCICDVQMVATNALTSNSATGVLGNCDAAFYSTKIAAAGQKTPIEILQHEGVLMSAPFCCSVLDDRCSADAEAKNYTLDHSVASGFCNALLSSLSDLGVDLCPNATLAEQHPPCYICGGADQEITLPDRIIPIAEVSCAVSQAAGLAGLVSPEDCALATSPAFAGIVRGTCGCTGPDPTPSPVAPGPEPGPGPNPKSSAMGFMPTTTMMTTMMMMSGLVVSVWM